MGKSKLVVPKPRDYGWELKPNSSVYFKATRNKTNQICVVLEHSLLRGITSEMLYWWFHHFPGLRVTLDDVEGYEGQQVPAYYLWHPTDHVSATLTGKVGPNNTSKVGAKIHIQEVMQFEKYGLRFPVDQALSIFYHDHDGWCMGKTIPLIGPLMSLRISFKDVMKDGQIIGVHYHYEIVAGSHKQNFIAKKITKKLIGQFDLDFWEAWLTHNTIEVGVFENFLPPLFEQRANLNQLHYSKDMNPVKESPGDQTGYSRELFDSRIKGYEESTNGFDYQQGTKRSIFS